MRLPAVLPLSKAAALHILKHEKVNRLLFQKTVNTANGRVIQAGKDHGLAPQTLLRELVEAAVTPDGFDRHLPLQPNILAQVDLTHAAGTNQPDQFDAFHNEAGQVPHDPVTRADRIIRFSE